MARAKLARINAKEFFVMGINRAIALMQDMAVFVAVVEAGSFTSAAKKLGATTSSVSRQVSRLEDCLHVLKTAFTSNCWSGPLETFVLTLQVTEFLRNAG
jgi:hypothetical protein